MYRPSVWVWRGLHRERSPSAVGKHFFASMRCDLVPQTSRDAAAPSDTVKHPSYESGRRGPDSHQEPMRTCGDVEGIHRLEREQGMDGRGRKRSARPSLKVGDPHRVACRRTVHWTGAPKAPRHIFSSRRHHQRICTAHDVEDTFERAKPIFASALVRGAHRSARQHA